MAETNGNGNISAPKIAWWLMVTLALILITAGGAWMTSVNQAQADNRAQVQSIQLDQAVLNQRLTRVETQLVGIESTTKDTATDVRAMRRLLEDRTDARIHPPPKYPLR